MGCSQLVESGYCPQHSHLARDKFAQQKHNAIYDRRWATVRLSFLRDNPLCVDCLANDIVTAAQDVHHIVKAKVAPELRLETTNLMALCSSCHRTRTAKGE
jgi:5-methylcytosine-specific restriction protein A